MKRALVFVGTVVAITVIARWGVPAAGRGIRRFLGGA